MLVEAGPTPPPVEARLDRLVVGTANNPSRFARWYRTTPPVVRGRVVGGSSVVNGGYFLRNDRAGFADWGGPFTAEAIEAAYDELDGGVVAGESSGTMSVSRLPDDQVSPLVRALEKTWRSVSAGPWPGIGAMRVPLNHRYGMRLTAADAYLSVPMTVGRPLRVRSNTSVAGLIVEKGRVVGVRLDTGEELRAGEVIVCGGTLGTAELLAGAGVVSSTLPFYEHREVLVRYRARTVVTAAPAILPTVAHTADRAEIRCYADDFGRFIPGVPQTSPAIGVVEMAPEQAGTLAWDGERLDVEAAPMGNVDAAIDSVVEALSSPDLAGLVVDGSVHVDPIVGASQHAWGSLAMGKRTDWLGALDGVPGLRVIDGSILPNVSSGPHATIMMAAVVIADALA